MDSPTFILEIDDSDEAMIKLRKEYDQLFDDLILQENSYIDSTRVSAMAVLMEAHHHLREHVLVLKSEASSSPTLSVGWEKVPFFE